MSHDQVINSESIEALRAVSPDDGGKFLTELIDIFLADTPARLADIDRALAAKDGATLVRAAHSIKGSAGNFGAERLAHLAHEIEKAAKANELAVAAQHATRIRAEYEAAELTLKSLRAP